MRKRKRRRKGEERYPTTIPSGSREGSREQRVEEGKSVGGAGEGNGLPSAGNRGHRVKQPSGLRPGKGSVVGYGGGCLCLSGLLAHTETSAHKLLRSAKVAPHHLNQVKSSRARAVRRRRGRRWIGASRVGVRVWG